MIVGLDIESISNFNYLSSLEKQQDFLFLSPFFLNDEILYCIQFDKPKSFAILFSLKESIIKILKNYYFSISFVDIEILNFYDKLEIIFAKNLKRFNSKIQVSFACDRYNVLSFAVLEEKSLEL